jgi:hypothetical protein
MKVINSEYARINYSVGGRTGTKWAKGIQVDKHGSVSFVSLETGQKKYLNEQCEYLISEVDELPPAVRDAAIESGMIDPAEAEPMGGTQ